MVLQPKERTAFFKNWLGLLAYVNDRHKLVKSFGHPQRPVGIKPDTITKIKTKLWEDTGIIDEYIDSAGNISEEDTQILSEWKNKKIGGPFAIVRHLKKYSVFLDDRNNVLYGVIGISGPISEMILAEILPKVVETVLLPFGDRIIYDSLFQMHNTQIGPNAKKKFEELYSEIKEKKGIISTLV